MLPLLAIGAAVGGAAISTLGGLIGGNKASKAQEAYIRAQQQAEKVRLEQMRFDADRQRRRMIREAIIARSTAVAQGANRGVSNNSSILPGTFGQIASNTGFGITGINANQAFGEQMFKLNQSMLQARLDFNDAQSTTQMFNTIGRGLSSLGGAIGGNIGTLNGMFNSAPAGMYGPNYNPSIGIAGVAPYYG